MSKQVNELPATETVSPVVNRQLFLTVNTYDSNNAQVGHRVVDLYHFGTNKWMSKHFWWAAHQGYSVDTQIASDEEVAAYMESAKQALADKFNKAA